MGQNTLKINEGICQRVIRTCKKSTLIWKNFPIKKYRGEGFLAKNAVFSNFAKFGEILQPLSGGCGSRLSIKKKMLESRPEDALVILVKLVKSTVMTVETVETVEIVETVETVESVIVNLGPF